MRSAGAVEVPGKVLGIAESATDSQWQGAVLIPVQEILQVLRALVATHCLEDNRRVMSD